MNAILSPAVRSRAAELLAERLYGAPVTRGEFDAAQIVIDPFMDMLECVAQACEELGE